MTIQGNHIGTLVKSHGFQGELILKGNSEILKTLKKGTPLFIEINKQRVPFFIEDISLDSTGEKCILKLEFIKSDTEARKYCSLEVYSGISRSQTKGGGDISIYISYTVQDRKSGKEYSVSDFYDHSNNPLLVLLCDKNEVLLPLNADYVLNIDHDQKMIIVELPEGLFD